MNFTFHSGLRDTGKTNPQRSAELLCPNEMNSPSAVLTTPLEGGKPNTRLRNEPLDVPSSPPVVFGGESSERD